MAAKSMSKIKGFRKGLVIALLLDLDIPIESTLDELWKMGKPTLEKMLWNMVCCQLSFFTALLMCQYVTNFLCSIKMGLKFLGRELG
jgi:hypothetical protein